MYNIINDIRISFEKELCITQHNLNVVLYGLLFIPIILFLLFVLKFACLVFIIPAIAILFSLIVYEKEDQSIFKIKVKYIILIFFLAFLWSFLCGQGGWVAQKPDHHWRNAIMRDMVNYDWPVVYENGTGLVYYILYWVVPTAIGKVGVMLGGPDWGWSVTNFSLLFWSSTWITTIIIATISIWNKSDLKSILIASSILIFFSGLDIIGYVIYGLYSGRLCFPWNIEWWLNWSGNITIAFTSPWHQLSWVFNQAVPAWALTVLFYRTRRISHFALLGVLFFAFAPFPFIGFFMISVLYAITQTILWIKEQQYMRIFYESFSVINILAVLFIFPIFFLYYSCNTTVESTSISASVSSKFMSFVTVRNLQNLFNYSIFLLLEFGILWFILRKFNKNDFLYYIIALVLIFIAGTRFISMDYIIRSSIPALFILSLYAIKYYLCDIDSNKLTNSWNYCRTSISYWLITIVLLIGSVTPLCECFDTLWVTQDCVRNGYDLPADRLKSFSQPTKGILQFFLVKDASIRFFYMYIAQVKQEETEKPIELRVFSGKQIYEYKP